MEALWKPGEVAEKCRKSEATLAQWRYLKFGPPYIKVGRNVRYRPSDVEKWLQEQTHQAA